MITGETRSATRARAACNGARSWLTRDKDGAVLSRGGEVAVAAGIDEEPVDPTGAGDTLAAALCVGLQEDMPLARLAAFCNRAGTLVIRKRRHRMALPERGQVDAMVASGVCRVECMPLESLV
ncbi:MAG: PfkB family carbohydrate kinase [Ruthenibacterium lactatiformans]